ncbi:MAG: flagellar FlbD family protein [Actinomycetota bacterium]|nr:flagellar FlbD family protein [Actinomycetota bacterium]
MIRLTRLDGSNVVVNADLIETVEATPDTVLHLVNGNRYIVQESVDELVDQVQAFRARVLEMGTRRGYDPPRVVGGQPAPSNIADLSAVEHLGAPAPAAAPPEPAPAGAAEPAPAAANDAALGGEGDDPWIR